MKKLICILFGLTLSACTTIEFSENTLIRPDEKPLKISSLGPGYTLQSVEVTHADGAVSRGIYLSNPHSIATVLYFGGNEFRIERESTSVIEGLAKAAVDIVIFDHRGYGRSDGTPTAALLQSDGLDLYRFVKGKAVTKKVVVYGFSLGSYVACHVAQHERLDGLVLEGVVTNIKEWASSFVPWFAKPFVAVKIQPDLQEIDNVKTLNSYAGPLLILAGEHDEAVPVSLQRKLFELVTTSQKEMHVFPKFGHKGLITSADFPAVLRRFLEKEVGAST